MKVSDLMVSLLKRTGSVLGVVVFMMAVGPITVPTSAAVQLIPPTQNRVRVIPAANPSTTPSPAAMRFLASRGIHFVIPRVLALIPTLIGPASALSMRAAFPLTSIHMMNARVGWGVENRIVFRSTDGG